MKLLLDSMMPDRITRFLIGHDVTHVVDVDWQHLTNGKLIAAAEAAGYDVLITKDANMPFQQNLANRSVSLVVLRPASQDFDDLAALAPQILRVLPTRKPGSVTLVAAS